MREFGLDKIMTTSKERKNIGSFESFEVLLGMRELPKVPEVEVYKGQQFLFSTGKKSNNQRDENAVKKQRTNKVVGSMLGKAVVALQHKRLGKRTGKFSLFSTQKISGSTMNWFDRAESQYTPSFGNSLSLVKKQRSKKLKMKLLVFKRKWQHYIDTKRYDSALKKSVNKALVVHNTKKAATTFDKLFNYYEVQVNRNMYAHKAFIALEMQLNSMLSKTRLAPYQHMTDDLCFYDLVRVNGKPVRNSHHVLGLYDTLSVPVQFHNYIYLKDSRIVNYPSYVRQFFKDYWAHTNNVASNKVWLLSNFVKSDVTAEAVIFDYPNVLLYMAPFTRFTKMFYESTSMPGKGTKHEWLNYTHTVLKLKLFEFASYYK